MTLVTANIGYHTSPSDQTLSVDEIMYTVLEARPRALGFELKRVVQQIEAGGISRYEILRAIAYSFELLGEESKLVGQLHGVADAARSSKPSPEKPTRNGRGSAR